LTAICKLVLIDYNLKLLSSYVIADAGRELCFGLTLLKNTLIHPEKSALTRTYPAGDVGVVCWE